MNLELFIQTFEIHLKMHFFSQNKIHCYFFLYCLEIKLSNFLIAYANYYNKLYITIQTIYWAWLHSFFRYLPKIENHFVWCVIFKINSTAKNLAEHAIMSEESCFPAQIFSKRINHVFQFKVFFKILICGLFFFINCSNLN